MKTRMLGRYTNEITVFIHIRSYMHKQTNFKCSQSPKIALVGIQYVESNLRGLLWERQTRVGFAHPLT